MTQPNLYDVLEICLQMLERGASVETCTARYPEFAEELRPILMAAVRARSATAQTVPVDVVRRNKAKVLQAAAEMREEKRAVVLPFWRRSGFFGARFARLAVTAAAMITFLLTGGTGLVNASSSAIPGDQLYPVKRSWEGVRLAFVFDQRSREELEHMYDQERVQEIEELYSEKRIAEVNFQGVVQAQNDKSWLIGGLNIRIEDHTTFSGDILPGAVVQVVGETDDGHIKASRITLLATPGVTASPFPSSTEAFTDTPYPSGTPTAGDNEAENKDVPTLIPATSTESDGSYDMSGTSTPRSGDDSGENGSGNGSSSPAPTGTAEHSGDGEHHSGTITPQPTEEHYEHRTPRPTEGH